MKLSKNWISKFVTIPKKITTQELADKITLCSFELDGWEDLAQKFEGVVVAEILQVSKHPNADKLQLAKVNDGQQILDIVCGAPNIAVGQKVPLAKVGTFLPAVKMKIEEREVRGQKSQGMLCAADELGLGSDHSGIFILSDNLPNGQPLAQALSMDDVIFELDNKAINNRPDLWGHYGVAREIAALVGGKLKEYKTAKISEGKERLDIEIKSPKVLRYSAVKMDGLIVAESPAWLKNQLLAIGQKPINNIVDVTNYVMYEFGQPMHAFDSARIGGARLIVRNASKGEKVLALDEKEYVLSADDLVIADQDKVLAVAGVIGGKSSAINSQTTSIVLESANFEHVSVRKTSQRLGLRTESSARFEKSLDPNMTRQALEMAVELITKVCPHAKVISKVFDQQKFKLELGPIKTDVDFIQKRIGQAIPAKQMVGILESLGFGVSLKGKNLSVKIPTWRATKDVSADYDLVEEVARVYGFNNIKPQSPTLKITRAPEDPLRKIIRLASPLLAYGYQMHEVYNYSFVSEDLIRKIGEDPAEYIRVLNPQAKGLDLVRRSLLPNLLLNVLNNARFYDQFSLFEIGINYLKEQKGLPVRDRSNILLPGQDHFVGGAVYQKGGKEPFYQAKNIVDGLMHRLHLAATIENLKDSNKSLLKPWLSAARFAVINVDGQAVGYLAEVSQQVLKKIGIKERVAVFEINLSVLADKYTDVVEYSPIPKYPSIEMDISMILSKPVLWQDILDVIKGLSSPLIRNVELFDIYFGEGIPEGQKSVAFRLTYRSDDKTLELAEAEAVHNKVKEQLKKVLQATIRES